MASNLNCSICSSKFTTNNFAWIMTICCHNMCNQCMKTAISKRVKSLFCKQCGADIEVDQEILQQFPKNITIIKSLRDPKNASSAVTVTQNKKIQIQQNNQVITPANSSIKITNLNCPKHGKPLQIICTVDKDLLCAHCAIFGEHQNHIFRTIEEFTADLTAFKHSCNQAILKKQIYNENLQGKKYRSMIVTKVNEKKDKILFDIRQAFKKILTQLKQVQAKLYEELQKCFRTTDSEITKILKDDYEVDKIFTCWIKQAEEYIKEVEFKQDLKDKVQVYYKPDKPNAQLGIKFLQQMERNSISIKEAVDQKISSIRVEFNPKIIQQFMSFGNIISNQIEIKVKPKINFEQFKDFQEQKYIKKQMKIQFVKSSQVQIPIQQQTERQSPIKKNKEKQKQQFGRATRSISGLLKVKSNPKLPKPLPEKIQPQKKTLTPQKATIKNLEQTMKHAQNLEFAARMVQQFFSSSDTLDITGCDLEDDEILRIVSSAANQKHIKCLKVCKNKLGNHGLQQLIPYLCHVTSLNLSHNNLTDDCIDYFVDKRENMLGLRIINLGHNKINERKIKTKTQELRKYGIITTV